MCIKDEIIDLIKDEYIDCPECEFMYSDDQYTCTTCWSEGGQGKINIFKWLKENQEVLNKKDKDD